VGPAGRLLNEGPGPHVRRRGCHWDRDGVPVRDELVGLLPVRGRHLRRTTGAGRDLRVLPRVGVPWCAPLRSPTREIRSARSRRCSRRGGVGHVGVLDPRRKLVDADAGRLRGDRWEGRPGRLLGGGLQPIHPAASRSHDRVVLGGRGVPGRGRCRVLPVAELPHGCGGAHDPAGAGGRSGGLGPDVRHGGLLGGSRPGSAGKA